MSEYVWACFMQIIGQPCVSVCLCVLSLFKCHKRSAVAQAQVCAQTANPDMNTLQTNTQWMSAWDADYTQTVVLWFAYMRDTDIDNQRNSIWVTSYLSTTHRSLLHYVMHIEGGMHTVTGQKGVGGADMYSMFLNNYHLTLKKSGLQLI